MIGWIILGIIVLIVVLILMIPVGADIRYEDEVIRISAKAAGIRFQILPRKKRSEKPAAEKEKKPEENLPVIIAKIIKAARQPGPELRLKQKPEPKLYLRLGTK